MCLSFYGKALDIAIAYLLITMSHELDILLLCHYKLLRSSAAIEILTALPIQT